jgi:hypothetical protein
MRVSFRKRDPQAAGEHSTPLCLDLRRAKALSCVASIVPIVRPPPSFWAPPASTSKTEETAGAPGPVEPASGAPGPEQILGGGAPGPIEEGGSPASSMASPSSACGGGFAEVVVRRCKDARSAVRKVMRQPLMPPPVLLLLLLLLYARLGTKR